MFHLVWPCLAAPDYFTSKAVICQWCQNWNWPLQQHTGICGPSRCEVGTQTTHLCEMGTQTEGEEPEQGTYQAEEDNKDASKTEAPTNGIEEEQAEVEEPEQSSNQAEVSENASKTEAPNNDASEEQAEVREDGGPKNKATANGAKEENASEDERHEIADEEASTQHQRADALARLDHVQGKQDAPKEGPRQEAQEGKGRPPPDMVTYNPERDKHKRVHKEKDATLQKPGQAKRELSKKEAAKAKLEAAQAQREVFSEQLAKAQDEAIEAALALLLAKKERAAAEAAAAAMGRA